MVTLDGSVGYMDATRSWESVEDSGRTREICSGTGIRIGFTVYL